MIWSVEDSGFGEWLSIGATALSVHQWWHENSKGAEMGEGDHRLGVLGENYSMVQWLLLRRLHNSYSAVCKDLVGKHERGAMMIRTIVLRVQPAWHNLEVLV
jgi:hypothetical protein